MPTYTIKEYIDSLTQLQRKKYKKLIKQCLINERQYARSLLTLAKSFRNLDQNFSELVKKTYVEKEMPPKILAKIRKDYLKHVKLDEYN